MKKKTKMSYWSIRAAVTGKSKAAGKARDSGEQNQGAVQDHNRAHTKPTNGWKKSPDSVLSYDLKRARGKGFKRKIFH